MDRRWLLPGLFFSTLVAMAVACSAPETKQPLVVESCEPGLKDCAKKRPAQEESEETTSQVNPVEQPVPAPAPEAGAPDAAQVGEICAALSDCCDALAAAGITGSARQCREVVEARSETACGLMNEDFKTPEEGYDPVCF